MRVRATAAGSSLSNAIGQLELSCTPAGLSIGMYGLGAFTEGYAVGALTTGTRFTIPYEQIEAVRAFGDVVHIELTTPSFPHKKLTLSRFTPGPGVPLEELRRRRLILHFSALALAALASLAAGILAPSGNAADAAWTSIIFGGTAFSIVLAAGYAVDQAFFLRPPGEDATRAAFVSELERYFPRIVREGAPVPERKKVPVANWWNFMPQSATLTGVVMAAAVLTALVTGQRLLMDNNGPSSRELSANVAPRYQQPEREEHAKREELPAAVAPTVQQPPTPQQPAQRASDPQFLPPSADASANSDVAPIERRCMCDRADSQLWNSAIPKLSALLIERRAIPTKTHTRTRLELAVINNSDSPMDEITLHVQFYEQKNGKRTPTKERPLYFEGPLRPGEAIKWTTEARGTDFEIAVPDFGNLGPNGDGAAQADAFYELLKANHRPVRLHAARILSFLGDGRARDAALELKDAMRAAEAPFLRRVLMATGDFRVCDVEHRKESAASLGACVYNASDTEQSGLGVQLNALEGSLDVSQPLADPPSVLDTKKWQIPGEVPAQSGVYVRLPLSEAFPPSSATALEVMADRYDLLD